VDKAICKIPNASYTYVNALFLSYIPNKYKLVHYASNVHYCYKQNISLRYSTTEQTRSTRTRQLIFNIILFILHNLHKKKINVQ